MRGTKHIAAALLGTAFLGASPAGAAISLDFAPVDNSAVLTGYTTYDMRVTTDTDWTAGAMLFELSAGSFYQHAQGTDGGVPHPFLVSLYPELAFDTYLAGSVVGGGGDIGRREAQLVFDAGVLDVSWYNLDRADIGTTTIARLTLTDDAAGSMSIMLSAAGNEIATFDVGFVPGTGPSVAQVMAEQAPREPTTEWVEPTYAPTGYWDTVGISGNDTLGYRDFWRVPLARTEWLAPTVYRINDQPERDLYYHNPILLSRDLSGDAVLASGRDTRFKSRLNTWYTAVTPAAGEPTVTNTTPEPSTLMLVGTFLGTAALRRR